MFFDSCKLFDEITFVIHRLGRDLTSQRTSIHRVVLLSESDGVTLFGCRNRRAGGEIRSLGSAERISIKTAVHPDKANKFTSIRSSTTQLIFVVKTLAVTERNDQSVFGLTERNKNGKFQGFAVHRHLDQRRLAVLTFSIRTNFGVFILGNAFNTDHGTGRLKRDDLIVNTKFFRRFWGDKNRVVPSEFGNRIGSFLEPAVVNPATIVNGCVG